MAETAAEADAGSAAQHERLSGRELALLQVLARGYALGQASRLFGAEEGDVVRDLRRAGRALGASTLPAAIAEARRRGLIS